MKKILFLCTGNSCRSQMAEGLLRHLGGNRFEAESAGLFPAGLHSRAVSVMREIGVDISGQRSKEISEALLKDAGVVVTLCGNAERYCPVPPVRTKRLYWPIRDPVGTVGTEEEIMAEFRRARDEIKKKIEEFLKENH